MKAKVRLILMAAAIGLVGCAAGPSSPSAPAGPSAPALSLSKGPALSLSKGPALSLPTAPTVAPVQLADAAPLKPEAKKIAPLDDVEPRVALPPGKGVSTGYPPLEAVRLYAESRAALLDHDRPAAIDLLQRAVAADPLSYELRMELARLYLTPKAGFTDRSIKMLEQAAELDPDHLDLQIELGRQYLAKGDEGPAKAHFRQALMTRQYKAGAPACIIAEFFLANLLRGEGYTSAAMEIFQRLSFHLKAAAMLIRVEPEIEPLLDRTDSIDADIADLLNETGRFAEAADAYAKLVERNPGNFETRAREVRLLIALGKHEMAVAAAESSAVYFRADSESIALLNEACKAAGLAGGAAGALSRLHTARPKDLEILYALADLLRSENRDADAMRVLTDADATSAGDFGILRRRFAIALHAGDRTSAAAILVHGSAANPDSTIQSANLWNDLTRPTSNGRFRWADLQALKVPESDEKARWFWVARLAGAAHRRDVARAALARAGDFPPAFRERLDDLWNREDLSEAEKSEQTQKLAAEAGAGRHETRTVSREALRHEIVALGLLRQDKPAEAAESFARAMQTGGKSADLLLARANALRRSGDNDAADSLLWKLISDQPSVNEAYLDLYLASIREGKESEADHVVMLWLAAEPDSITAWTTQALQFQRSGRHDAAEKIFVRLFKEHPDDGEAVSALGGFYLRRHLGDRFIALLETRHADDLSNFAVSSALAETLAADNRQEAAARVVDSARIAAANDADLLYSVSGLYARIGSKQASEDALREALKADPTHAAAANDLGFTLADDGRNLPEAESLLRQALKLDPDNVSFLDSMGWVLYKRGRFAEARQFLNRAIGNHGPKAGARSDPVVLDHRGDILYRLGEKEAAASDWQQAADRIAALKTDADAEMKTLQERLAEKSRLLKAGKSVPVAPVIEAATPPNPP